MTNIWIVNCMKHKVSGMWQRWFRNQCVAVGWPPPTRDPSVQTDQHMIAAGECFVFLLWVQSAMCDLLALEALSPESRARYNAAHKANAPWPRDFSIKRLELSEESFGTLKGWFLDKWPEWREHDVHASIERVLLLRNAIGHAQVQPLRPYLLHVPKDKRWAKLEKYFTCGRCGLPLKTCACEHGFPKALRFPCQEPWFLESLYGDIRSVDEECLLPTAVHLAVAYQGCAWPTEDGNHTVTRHCP